MDTLKKYRQIVREVLQSYTEIEYANVDAKNDLVCDENGDRYLILSLGWSEKPRRRVHVCLIHLDIIDTKVWIQRDGTEDGVAGELEEAGIPKSDIVLGFQDPQVRHLTDYAVA